MNPFIPENDLDRAVRALQKSRAATPDLYRQLCAGELWFAIRYHPELEEGGGFEIENGAPAPFIRLTDKEGEFVPVFSSGERFDESLQRDAVPERKFLAAAMPAKQLLQILGAMNLRATVNMGCATGSVKLSPELMRDLASGAVLRPQPLHGQQAVRCRLRIVPPEEFPTDLIQPVFECLRQHRQFRAAFVLTKLPDRTAAGQPRRYNFGIVMEPEDEVVCHDLNLVLAAACGRQYAFELMLLDAETTVAMFQAGAPFYTAIDYQPPATAG